MRTWSALRAIARIDSNSYRRIAFGGALLLLATLVACSNPPASNSGGQTSSQPTVTSVTVSCSPTTVQAGQTSKCAANVSGTGNFSRSVTWSTDNGTIDQNGNFTAPSSATTASVKATSQQDSTKVGSATVTVTALTVTISPTSAQIQVFHSQQFTASVPATWAVNNVPGGNLTVGQIDSTGFYLAPNTLPNPSAITVTATSQADTTQSASASVAVLPDAAGPTIISTTPAAAATNVTLDSTIQIQFSDLLDASTVNASSFVLTSGSNPVTCSVTYDSPSNTVTIAPAGIFATNTQYTVEVQSVADPAGLPIAAPSQWSFTTQGTVSANGIVSDSFCARPDRTHSCELRRTGEHPGRTRQLHRFRDSTRN